MRRHLPGPLKENLNALMERAGYRFHCTKDGRPCYHRRLHDPRFPRFHAYAVKQGDGMEIDLHFDALDSVTHKGNHDQSWSYTGSRVAQEMDRLIGAILGFEEKHEVVGSEHVKPTTLPPPKKRSLFDLLFH